MKNQRRKGESAVTGHRKSSVLQGELPCSKFGGLRRLALLLHGAEESSTAHLCSACVTFH